MINIPQELKESGIATVEKREFNRLVRYVRSLKPIQNDTVQIEHTVNGVSIRAKPSTGTTESTTAPRWG
jgi:hypothetical protein